MQNAVLKPASTKDDDLPVELWELLFGLDSSDEGSGSPAVQKDLAAKIEGLVAGSDACDQKHVGRKRSHVDDHVVARVKVEDGEAPPKRPCHGVPATLVTGFSDSSSEFSDQFAMSSEDDSDEYGNVQLPVAQLFHAVPADFVMDTESGAGANNVMMRTATSTGSTGVDGGGVSSDSSESSATESECSSEASIDENECGAPTALGFCENGVRCCWAAHQQWRARVGICQMPHIHACIIHPHKLWQSCVECMELRCTARSRLTGTVSRPVELPFPIEVGIAAMMGEF